MVTLECSIGECVKTQGDATVTGQLVSTDCLGQCARLMTQHTEANAESTVDGVVRKTGETWSSGM